MSSVTQLTQSLIDVLTAALSEIDAADAAGYEPAIESQSIALIGTALGHSDEGHVYSMGWVQTVHHIRLELWTKFDQGDAAACITRARDVGHRAIKALVAADGTGAYNLMAAGTGVAIMAATDSQMLVVNSAPYIRTVLTIPCWQKETV